MCKPQNVVRLHFLKFFRKSVRHLLRPTTEGKHFSLWIILNIRSGLSSMIFENFMWYGYTFYNFRINSTAFVVGDGVFIENKATISGFRQQGHQSIHSRETDAPSLTNLLEVHS